MTTRHSNSRNASTPCAMKTCRRRRFIGRRSAYSTRSACTLAGAREDTTRIVRSARCAAPAGRAWCSAATGACRALDAALVNGTASHALDFDDCNNTHRRPPVGADPAGAVRARRRHRRERPRLHRRLRRGLRDRVQDRRSASTSITTPRAGTRPRRSASSAAAAACAKLLKLPEDKIATRARDRGLARVRHQGQLRHHGEAAARRPLHAQRPVRGAARARRLHARTRARSSTSRASSMYSTARAITTPAKVLPDLGAAARHREARHRGQAVPVLRQHALRARRDARRSCASTSPPPTTSSAWTCGRTRAGSSTPTGPTRRATSTPSSACSTA